MDENRVAGTARNIGGKAQESVGRAFGDTKTQAEGVVNQVKGAAQDLYGQARDSASQIADAGRAWSDSTSSQRSLILHFLSPAQISDLALRRFCA